MPTDKHKGNIGNLKPWRKGQSGNPKGRPPKHLTITSLLKEELEKVPEGEKSGKTWLELIVLAWLHGAITKPELLKELVQRIDGPVTHKAEFTLRRSLEEMSDEELDALNRQAQEYIDRHEGADPEA